MKYTVLTLLLLLTTAPAVFASAVREGHPLPGSRIDTLGELVLAKDEFDYRTWEASQTVHKPHVLQYFPGTLQDSKIYEPFTDSLQAQYTLGTYHVTTIINLDEALWGTRGFVVSEVKRSKRKFPDSTIVLDDSGLLAREWRLGERGAGLVILDISGQVRYVHLGEMDDRAMAAAQAVFAELMTVSTNTP
jgi:YtfJ family uncharacterized protein